MFLGSHPEIDIETNEFDGRLRKVQNEITSLSLDAIVVTLPANYHYLTGFQTGSSASTIFLIVPATGTPLWVMRGAELSNIEYYRKTTAVIGSLPIQDTDLPVDILSDGLRKMGLGSGRIGLEYNSLYFFVSQYLALKSALPQADFVSSQSVVEKVRRVKSPAEIACMKKAGENTARTFRACLSALHEGVTDSELAAVILSESVRNGGGRIGGLPYIAVGQDTTRAHVNWYGRRVLRGEILNVEFACSYQRYHVPTFRGMCLGLPDSEAQALHRASIVGLEAGMRYIKPGMTSHDADKVVRDAIGGTGFGDKFKVRAAYGIGLAFPPSWGEGEVANLRAGDNMIVLPGMTFHLVPALIGDCSTACCSMPILITDAGVEGLMPLAPDILIAS